MKEKLVLDNLKLIPFVLKKLGVYDLYDELYDIGLISLVKAANNFDPDRGLSFTTVATVYIRNDISRTMRERYMYNRRANYNALSLDAAINKGSGDEELLLGDVIPSDFDMEEYIIKNEQIHLLRKAISTLEGRDRQIILMYLDGKTQKEIAKIIGVSQAQVSRRMSLMVEKFKKEINRKEKR